MPLLRGTSERIRSPFTLPCPVERFPRNTPSHVHTYSNEWFLKKFNIPYRSNALFCTPDINIARAYSYSTAYPHAPQNGTILLVKPQGDYKICWSKKICDLYKSFLQEFSNDLTSVSKAEIFNFLDNSDYSSQDVTPNNISNLDEALQYGNEIMIHANTFLLEPYKG